MILELQLLYCNITQLIAFNTYEYVFFTFFLFSALLGGLNGVYGI